MKIDEIKSHKIFRHRLVIDFQYQSINWHRLLSIGIDYHRLSVSTISQAGLITECFWKIFSLETWHNKVAEFGVRLITECAL